MGGLAVAWNQPRAFEQLRPSLRSQTERNTKRQEQTTHTPAFLFHDRLHDGVLEVAHHLLVRCLKHQQAD